MLDLNTIFLYIFLRLSSDPEDLLRLSEIHHQVILKPCWSVTDYLKWKLMCHIYYFNDQKLEENIFSFFCPNYEKLFVCRVSELHSYLNMLMKSMQTCWCRVYLLVQMFAHCTVWPEPI